MGNFSIEAEYNGEVENNAMPADKKKKNLSINVREIKNGFIVTRSWDEDTEDGCTKWMSEDEYSKENPITIKQSE